MEGNIGIVEVQDVLTEHYPEASAYYLYGEAYNLARIEFAGKPQKSLDVEVSYMGATPEDTRIRVRKYLEKAFCLSHQHVTALSVSTIGMEGIAVTDNHVVFYYPDRYYARTGLKRPETEFRHDHAFVLVPTRRPFVAIFTNRKHILVFEIGDQGIFVTTTTKNQSQVSDHVKKFRERYRK